MDGPHIKARLTLLPTENGGRRSPVFSGYRPQFRYLGRDNDVSIDLLNRESLCPGDTDDVYLTFFRPELQLRRIAIDTEFELAEGAKPVARGTITEVIQPELAGLKRMIAMSPIPLPVEVPIWGLVSLEITRQELHTILGEPHFVETDPTRTCGGEEDAWAYKLPSSQRLLVILDVTSGWAELFSDLLDSSPLLQAVGIMPDDQRLKHHDPVEMK